MDPTLDFIAGCLGGCAGVLVGHPFDTVKVRLQLDSHVSPRYSGTFHCFQSIAKQESLRGLYKGVTSPLSSLAFINAIIFGVQGNVIKRMENPNALSSHFKAGIIAGLSQSWICSPMELVKTKMQNQGQGQSYGSRATYKSAADCFGKIYKAEGVRGVYRGMGATICREIPAFGTYFLSYEYLTRLLTPEGSYHCPTSGLLVAGGLAGCSSWFVTYPIDIIKSRIQADGSYKNGTFRYSYAGYSDCIRQTLSVEGYRGLFKGLTPTMVRAFPTNAATFTVVSLCLRHMRPNESEEERLQTLERASLFASHEG